MRIERSILSLMLRGTAVGLVAMTTGCPGSAPIAPTPTPPATTTTTPPIPTAPIVSETAPEPAGQPEVKPNVLPRVRTKPADCGGKHENMQKCPSCSYCPPCGGG